MMEVVLFLCFLFLDLCVLEVVLTYKKDQVTITEDILETAAGND